MTVSIIPFEEQLYVFAQSLLPVMQEFFNSDKNGCHKKVVRKEIIEDLVLNEENNKRYSLASKMRPTVLDDIKRS